VEQTDGLTLGSALHPVVIRVVVMTNGINGTVRAAKSM